MAKDSMICVQRKRVGLTQKELSDKAGVNTRQIQKYESGEYNIRNMTLGNALSLSNALGCDAKDLCLDQTAQDGKAIKYFTHYGVHVSKQTVDKPFVEVLRAKNIKYTELPIIDTYYDVVTYVHDDVKRYAIIKALSMPDDYGEHVYITTAIPDDLSWDNLIKDIDNQGNGEKPMIIKTKLQVTVDYLVGIQEEEYREKMVHENISVFTTQQPVMEIDFKRIRLSLISRGFDLTSCDIGTLDPVLFDKIIKS